MPKSRMSVEVDTLQPQILMGRGGGGRKWLFGVVNSIAFVSPHLKDPDDAKVLDTFVVELNQRKLSHETRCKARCAPMKRQHLQSQWY